MDERHWWIATKLQQTFKSDKISSSNFAEDFLSDQDIVDKINEFIAADGSNKLIFHCQKAIQNEERGSVESEKLQASTSAVRLKDLLLDNSISVVFIRTAVGHEIEPSLVEKEAFMLELKSNALSTFASLLNNAYLPLFKARTDWGECIDQDVVEFLMHADRYASTLQEYAAIITIPHHLLRRPNMLMGNELKHSRLVTVNHSLIAEYETLVQDWMQTIESLLLESIDERPDVFSGPLSELEIWQRRQRVLLSVADQLKNKECKTVIGILITTKSRVLKKWKVVDAGLTDAINETKDKVKYLESLRRYFDQLGDGYSPSHIANVTIPAIMSAVKQMDNISKFYAKIGFLGVIFTKITNQLVMCCKSSINTSLTHYNQMSSNSVWDAIENDISQSEEASQLNTPIESPVRAKRGAQQQEFTVKQDLLTILNSCLLLHKQYRDQLRHLRDSLGGSHALQHVAATSLMNSAKKYTSTSLGSINVGSLKPQMANLSPSFGSPDKGRNRPTSPVPGIITGIAITDENAIIGYFDLFSQRVHNIIDLIETLRQFSNLKLTSSGLPVLDFKSLLSKSDVRIKDSERSLEVDEGEKLDNSNEEDESGEGLQYSDEEMESIEEREDVPAETVTKVISRHVDELTSLLKRNLAPEILLGIDGKGKSNFENSYAEFIKNVGEVETFITDFVKNTFKMKWKTMKALEILGCFKPVASRIGLRPVFSEKYIEVFIGYEKDLDDIRQTYEDSKDDPPIERNSPKVAGSIFWSRGLLRRIAEPMKIFRDIKFVSTLRDFSRIVKIYHRLASVLIKYEEVFLSAWKSQIEAVKIGLKAPLLRRNEDKEIELNSEHGILEVMTEVKWMKRLNIQVPNSAVEIFQQETRFKSYYHQLNWVMKLYHDVREKVPKPLRKLMAPLTESILYYLHPGLSTVTWSSLNIDAYLHHCHSAVQKLQKTVENVCKLVKEGLDDSIEKIKLLTFFDEQNVSGKTWKTGEFVSDQHEFSMKIAKKLAKYISGMESALQQTTGVIVQQMVATGFKSPSPTPGLFSSSPYPGSRASSVDPILYNKASRNLPSPPNGLLDDAALADVKVHYCSQVYEAVLIAIRRSLHALINTIDWRHLEIERVTLHECENLMKTNIQFDVEVQFLLPDLCTKPSLDDVQLAINKVAHGIVDISRTVHWWAKDSQKTFHSSIISDDSIKSALKRISLLISGLQSHLDKILLSFKRFDFLWQDDLQFLFRGFSDGNPGLPAFHREVERLQQIQQDLVSIPDRINLGSLVLSTIPVKDCLYGFAVAWKICYAQPIHESAKNDLKMIVEKRESFRNQLTSEISSLDQLNSVLNLLQELHDLENTIDDLYLPVEITYKKLLAYDVNIARDEMEEVNALRHKWTDLLSFAAEIQWQLMQKKRSIFEQELDKQVKTFVVEVIQFRNSFDSQGPGVPGIIPSEAVRKLKLFHDQYRQLDHRRKVLDAVQIVFGIAPTPFPELDKTGEELDMLEMLYGLYQKFINFDQSFREQLWAEADLSRANQEIDSYWKDCIALPTAIRTWMAYKEMRDAIKTYIDVFPLLNKLASREIRNRHWLEVMAVTGTSFQLEANVFKLMHLLDSHLAEHKDEIEEIVQNAGKELDLEIRIRAIEEEWTEQVLNFEKFKSRGWVCLDKVNTEKLLEISEDAKASLAIMLTSKHVAPLRDEAASWAVKLKEVGEVLEQWLSVQELWQCLEEVFSNSATSKELPQESSRFARVDRTYMRTMKKAVEVRNVMQCCIGGDIPKNQMLKGLHEELEICFKSLAGYLNKKRKEFPRFYFVNDAALLNILSKPYNLDSVRPYLSAIFNGIHDIKLHTKNKRGSTLKRSLIPDVNEVSPQLADRRRTGNADRVLPSIPDASDDKSALKFGRSLTEKSSLFLDQLMTSEEWKNELPQLMIAAVSDAIGETINLDDEVLLINGVESWLKSLFNEVTSTLENLMQQCRLDIESGMTIEDWILKYPAQVSLMNLCHIWTMECEAGISEIRIERKAMTIALRRYTNVFNKIPQIISRGAWRNSDIPLTVVHQCRLESLISIGLYFRDVFEDLGKRKLKDISDFEWQRNMRLYFVNDEGNEKLILALRMLDANFDYGYEFLSCNFPVVLTPLTERCFLSLTQIVTHNSVGCLIGPTSTGKTQTIKGFSHMLGRFLISLSCLQDFEPNSIGRIFTGIAQEGAWCLFDELQQASNSTLSVIAFYIQNILNAIKSKQNTCYLLDSQQMHVLPNLSIFANVTTSIGYRFVLPGPASSLFRTISVIKPDFHTILRTHLAAQGFKSYKMLADKIKTTEEICICQIKTSKHILFNTGSMISVAKRAGEKRKLSQGKANETEAEGTRIGSPLSTVNTFSASAPKIQIKDRKLGTPVTLPAPVKVEHSIVTQSLIECIGSRLSQEEQVIFSSIVKDVFSQAIDRLNTPSNKEELEIEAMLNKVVTEKGLIAHQPWVSKAIQMFQLSSVFHGIIVCGNGGSGKTSCIENLIEALNEHAAGKQLAGSSKMRLHKLERMNVLAVSDIDLMFGHVKPTGDWVDGVFTSIWKRSNKSYSVTAMTTWICFDGPVQNMWCKNLKSVLDQGKYLVLPNAERLPITGNIKIMFETCSLEDVDPAIVSRMGLVYMDDRTLGWRPLADAWLAGRPTHHVHILQRAFRKVLDPVFTFMEQEARPCMRLSENVMFSSCLSLLNSLLQEHTDLGGDLHVERLFIFSLIWTFGGLLTREQDQKSFSQLLLAVSTALPDYDHYVSVFDYYVDDSGEWDNWEARLLELTYADSLDLLDDVFVETVDTMRARFLMELVSSVDKNILLVGPRGCGKTCMINDFYSNKNDKNTLVKRIAYSAGTTASELQKFMESVVYHRQGFVYGAEDNKKMILFCDDLNVATTRVKGNDFESANELLRQLLDSKMIFNLQKPFDRRFIEGLSITAALSIDEGSPDYMALSDRLLRHFYIIQLPQQSENTVRTIVSAVLEANMCANESAGLQEELEEQIINASCSLLASVREVLKPSPISGRRNYEFSMRDLKRIFQALKHCPEEYRADDENYLATFWHHEARRVFQDRIVQAADLNWFEETIKVITKEHFPSLPANSQSSLFATFAVDTHLVSQRSMTQMSRGMQRKIAHQPLNDMAEVTSCLQAFLTRYNEQFNKSLPVVLYEQSLKHLIRIHRILTFKGSGNALLIGSIGTHISSLVELVLYMINTPLHPIDCANKSSFFDGLRSAVRTAGCEGKQVAVMLSEKDLRDKSYLDAVDNILINGSCPLLFTEEELRSLISALVPAIKKEHSRFLSDPVTFFEIRVKLNLHIILCMQPRKAMFRNLARDYPGILSACHINWIMDWPSDALYGELAKYIEKHSLLDNINPHIIENVIRTMSGIHSRILKECNQIPWAGDYEESLSKEEETNLPYSKNILLHRIMHKDISWTGERKTGIFVGPTTFHRFMHCFHYVFNAKAVEINEKILTRRKALDALVQARANVANLKEMIAQLRAELGGTVKQTSELLNNLVAKATLRERLKAKFDKGSGTLKAFMELIDSEMEDDLTDSVLLDDHDEMDEEYERIKVTQQLSRKSKTIEESLKDAEKEVVERKSDLERSSEMVNVLQKKIDRGTIERLRAFQNPPTMVGMTMAMLMILIGRPEFASYVPSSQSKAERKQENHSYSDEASRISSATTRRKRDHSHKNANQQMGLTPDGRSVDKNAWKTIQVIMNDSQKFSEHINNLKWDRGISDEALKTVISFFAPGEETARGFKTSQSTGPNARSLVNPKTPNSEKKQQGVTLAAARYSSEDAAQVVEYIQAVIEFLKKSKPYQKAKQTLRELKIEREVMERKALERSLILAEDVPHEQPVYVDPIDGFTEDDLTRLDKEIEELRQQFDEIAIKKFNLQQKLTEYSEKLKNLTGLLDSLKPVEAVWKYFLDHNSALDILLTNSICASAFLTYCGPLGIDQRKRMSEFFLSICKENGVPTESKKLFKDVSLAKFLVGKQMLQMWRAMSFPSDNISLDNICIMTQKDCCSAWALLCDPQRVAVHWIEKLLQDTIVVKYKELRGELESCLTEGRTLLLSDVDLDSLVENEKLNSLLKNKRTFIRANAPFKLMIGEEEIECSPSFRLFIITSSPAHLVPTSIAAYTNVIEFSQSRDGLAEQFLYRFIKLEKQRIHGTLYQVEQEIVTYMVAQERAEEQLLLNLCSSDNPLSNFASIKQVSGIKRFYDEAQESLTKARNAEKSIMNSRETYRSIAVCAAVLFDVSRSMSIIKPLYQISFSQFVSVFDTSIKHSDRNAVSAVVAKLQYNSFVSRARGLFEEDRLLFALLVALEIEDANNRIEVGEREFLISPPFGAAIKQLSNRNWEIPPKTLVKKPFDWLMDEQYHNLQLLAQYYPWFLDTFEKMSKDGRETQWRQIAEHDRPEMLALPDNLDDRLLPIHRLLVIRAVRSDRLIQASTVFITMALGRRYAAQISVDLLSLARQATPKSPILLLYRKESEICEPMLANFASANQINLKTVQLCGMNGEEKFVKKTIKKLMTSGDWLLLLDGQNCLSLLESLESFLLEMANVDSNFRIWISCSDEASFPSSLLQSSIMAVIESPKMNLKSSVCHNLQSVDSDVWKRFIRNEWLPLLHNVCMLHSTLKIRHRYGYVGLRLPYEFDFGIKHLWASLNFLTNEFRDAQIHIPEGSTPSTPVSNFNQRSIQWHGLRYLLSEIVYGNGVSNELDASVLASMVDLWISSSASRKDFEIPRTKYKLPQTCFIPGSKQSAITQAIEAISDNRLEMPEMCGLYTSDETPLSDDQYTFTRLNLILDCMPSSNTLTHVPPTSSTLAGTSVPLVASSGTFHATGAGLLSLFNSSVFASASLTALRTSAKTDLFEISSTALDKLPRLWSRVFVNERIRKLGGPTPFNLFLLSEIDCFYQLHQELRSSLQAIKLATSEESFGDKLPEEYLKDAEELYHLRIPERFRHFAGSSSPPSSWALAAWLSDLQARFNHMEKILYQGKEKIPAYWLAAFFNPKRVLAVVMQESIRQYQMSNVVTEQFVFRTEITGRDKDHLREPSPDGMFIYGLYLWGCSWEKTIGELQDAPPKSGPSLLPVVHITAVPYSEKASLIDPQKSQFAYECPCYASRTSTSTSTPQPIFFVDIEHKEVASTKWPLRGICCTLRPF